MNKYPLVTAYIISYNKFQYLKESIASILSQDYPNIELLIFDDSSTSFPLDEFRDLIEVNKKENIKSYQIVSHSANLGTVKNVNEMIKSSHGEFFIGLSTDDVFFSSHSITEIVECFLTSNLDVFATKRLRCDKENLNPIREMPLKSYEKKIMKLNTSEKQQMAFLKQNYYEMASGSSIFFSRGFIVKWGLFDQEYTLWEDGPFLYQYTKRGNFLHLEYGIISKKYREGGISSVKSPKLIKDHILFFEKELIPDAASKDIFTKRLVKFNYLRLIKRNNSQSILFLYFIYMDCAFWLFFVKSLYFISTKIEIQLRKGDRHVLH